MAVYVKAFKHKINIVRVGTSGHCFVAGICLLWRESLFVLIIYLL